LLFLNAKATKDRRYKIPRKLVSQKDVAYIRQNVHLDWKDYAYGGDSLKFESAAEKGKMTRSIKQNSCLDVVNRRLNASFRRVLDKHVPDVFYGSVSGRTHILAAKELTNGKKTVFLSFDIQKFFESISSNRVQRFFVKAGCTKEIADFLVSITCVPLGVKGLQKDKLSLARGFPTSPRLALWCTFEIFSKLNRILQKSFSHLFPKIVLYVDDIGISLKNPSEDEIVQIRDLVFELIESDKNGLSLTVHRDPPKFRVQKVEGRAEHLGVAIGKSKIAVGSKTVRNIAIVKNQLLSTNDKDERGRVLQKKRGLMNYRKTVTKNNL